MTGGRLSFMLMNAAMISVLIGCGDRSSGAASAGDSAANAIPSVASADTAAVSDTAAGAASDTAAAPRRDTVAARRDTAPPAPKPVAARTAPPRKPAAAAKPAAPAPEPPATAPADSPPAAAPPAPADTTTSVQATTPLRDEYHRAPLDTVSQQVYDGWKQYNLNCARCHGEDVQGTTIAPHLVTSLKPNGPVNTKELFVQIVCAGRPDRGMPAWCPLGLEMDKIEAIHAYVKGRSDGKIRLGRPAVKPEG